MKKELLILPEHFAIHATALVNHVHAGANRSLRSMYDGLATHDAGTRTGSDLPARIQEEAVLVPRAVVKH